MRRRVFILIATFLLIATPIFAQQKENYPLPKRGIDTLKILGIGNSFTDDGMEYIPEILEAAGVHNVILGRLYIGGCSLERHCMDYEDGKSNYIYYKSENNKWVTAKKGASMLDGLLDEDWDIVVTQQVSGKSGQYDTYSPWLGKLMDIIREKCPNPKATIAWQQTWAYATNSTHGNFKNYDSDQNKMYNAIVNCVSKLPEDYNIDVIVPSGTAIQIHRGTEFNDNKDLTRDGYHLSHTQGRFVAACCWYERLVRPVVGSKSIVKNSCRLVGRTYREGKMKEPASVELTEEVAAACKKSAKEAMKMFK